MKKEEGRGKKEEGRRKREEGRRKKEEGRRKKEEGRRKKEEECPSTLKSERFKANDYAQCAASLTNRFRKKKKKKEGRRRRTKVLTTNILIVVCSEDFSPKILEGLKSSLQIPYSWIYTVILWLIGVSEIRKTNRRNVNLCLTD